nr:hypothetical protein [Delftia acidovorans]
MLKAPICVTSSAREPPCTPGRRKLRTAAVTVSSSSPVVHTRSRCWSPAAADSGSPTPYSGSGCANCAGPLDAGQDSAAGWPCCTPARTSLSSKGQGAAVQAGSDNS